jgi:hypothetical protein
MGCLRAPSQFIAAGIMGRAIWNNYRVVDPANEMAARAGNSVSPLGRCVAVSKLLSQLSCRRSGVALAARRGGCCFFRCLVAVAVVHCANGCAFEVGIRRLTARCVPSRQTAVCALASVM